MKFSPLPMARNLTPFGGRGACCVYDTCGEVCPSGARYSPDFTFRQLIEPKKIVLHDRTLVRRLMLDERRSTIVAAQGVHQDRPGDPIEYRAKTFVIASGYCWSSHLLLLSANSRFPNGLANRSGLVGRYMNGHKFINGDGEHRRSDVPGPEHDAQPDLARVFPLPDRIGRSSATTRGCGRAPRGAIRGCARRTARCCSATS